LTADSYVLDFVLLKDVVRGLCKQWDHRFLLPQRNPHLRVTDRADAWEIEYTGDLSAITDAPDAPIRYLMPKWTVIPLPVDNVTAERLAELLAQRIVHELRRRGAGQAVERLMVGIEETEMQMAFYSLDPREVPPV
jgi:6-pyruvoyltetrahydropterin/6-carboxytetrahydropterin synthase